jgi:hypothetical protein
MSARLHQTKMGKVFFERDVPRIADALERIAKVMETGAVAEPLVAKLNAELLTTAAELFGIEVMPSDLEDTDDT